jgi:hypothetical protein
MTHGEHKVAKHFDAHIISDTLTQTFEVNILQAFDDHNRSSQNNNTKCQ